MISLSIELNSASNFSQEERSIHEVLLEWVVATFGFCPLLSAELLNKLMGLKVLSSLIGDSLVHCLHQLKISREENIC